MQQQQLQHLASSYRQHWPAEMVNFLGLSQYSTALADLHWKLLAAAAVLLRADLSDFKHADAQQLLYGDHIPLH